MSQNVDYLDLRDDVKIENTYVINMGGNWITSTECKQRYHTASMYIVIYILVTYK